MRTTVKTSARATVRTTFRQVGDRSPALQALLEDADCKAWYEPSSLVTSGSDVTGWTNLSTHASKFGDLAPISDPADRPTVVGGIATFDGTQNLQTATGTLTQPSTTILVFQADGLLVSEAIVDSVGATNRQLFYAPGSGVFQVLAITPAKVIGTIPSSQRTVAVCKIHGANSTYDVTGFAQATGTCGTNNFAGLTVGAAYSGGSGLVGTIEYVILMDRALNPAELGTFKAL